MLDNLQKRKIKSVLYNKTTLFCLLLLVLYAIYSTFSVVIKKRESERLLSISEEQLTLLEERKAEIDSKINHLGTAAGLEAEIRSRFNMAKEGENVAIVVSTSEKKASSTPQKKTMWQRLFGR